MYRKYAIAAVGGLVTLRILYSAIKKQIIENRFEKIRQQKRDTLKSDIDEFMLAHVEEFNIDSVIKAAILRGNIKDIKQMIYSGVATVVQVLLVYIEQAVSMNTTCNFLCDAIFIQAYNEAELQDQELKVDKEIIHKHELFGIPVSIKDALAIQGKDTTFGSTCRCFKPELQDGYHVRMIRMARGIIFAKTNVPQVMKTIETQNFIFGRSNNPWDITRSPGGSSGGEAAMVAARGSVIGIGTDIGGSLRIPGAFCGVATHKPSPFRIHPYEKNNIPTKLIGWRQIQPVAGPMARCVDDLVTMMKVQYNPDFFARVPFNLKEISHRPIAFNQQVYKDKSKLRVGVMSSISYLPTTVACRRVVEEAAEVLRKQGHEIVEFKIEDSFILEALRMLYEILGGLDNRGIVMAEQIGDEKYIPEYKMLKFSYSLPAWLKKTLVFLMKLTGCTRRAQFLSYFSKSYDAVDVLQLYGEHMQVQERFKQLWHDAGIDVLLAPVVVCPAFPHGSSYSTQVYGCYSSFVNIMNFTSGSIPMGLVQADEQFYEPNNDFLDKLINKAMQGSQGLPLSVQVITKPFEDELCLRVMKDLEMESKFEYM